MTLAGLREALAAPAPLHDLVSERRDEIGRFEGVEQPPVLGPSPEEPPDDPFTRMMARMVGVPLEQPAGRSVVQANPGSAGVARGLARVVASLGEVGHLRPREYGIPAVVGAVVATSAIPDGALVEVDGTSGTVRILW